ncbi:DUF3800 domain-containing protein [Candidatus Woesearchaeota archaeon]|nr:DUF3800 domain-containing protein [Candidatus Woesearchaeota archaeon]
MERYVYIDETGDLGGKGSEYFVITAIWTDNPALLDRLVKNIRRHKFKKELKKVQEIKANKSSKELIENILKKFSEIDSAHAQSIILDKKKLYSKFLKEDKHKLYNFVCGHLAGIGIDSKQLVIRIDRAKGKQNLIDDFNKYIGVKFKEARWNREIEIYHSWSHSWSGLQIADVISWAVFNKFEHGNDYYFRLIEKKTNILHMWE